MTRLLAPQRIVRGIMSWEKIQLDNGTVLLPIPGMPNDDYAAGSDGKIYTCKKYGTKDGLVDWRPLVPQVKDKGYENVTICHHNHKITRTVHRLVCLAFHGVPESAPLEVRHLDGVPSNNKPDNLKWGTRSENWQDRYIHGTASAGEKHWRSTMTNEDRNRIRWVLSKGICSQSQMATAMGVTQREIFNIVHAKSDF
jgi:hypothetical protein